MTFTFRFLMQTLVAAFTIAALIALTAQAHESHAKPKHGGVVAEAATFQAELVIKQTTATIYLSDHGKDVLSKPVTGKLTVLADGKSYSVNLTSTTGNQLQATLLAPLKNGKFVAQMALSDKPLAPLRFELK